MQRSNAGVGPVQVGTCAGALSCGRSLCLSGAAVVGRVLRLAGGTDRDRLLIFPPVPFSLGTCHRLPGELSRRCSHTSTGPAPSSGGRVRGVSPPPPIIVSRVLSSGQELLGRPWNCVFSLSSEGFPSLFLPEQGLHVTLFLIVAP